METFYNVDLVIRLMIALACGFVLGLEREITNKYAGLRTHILVCMGACIFTLISIYGFPTFADGDNVVVANATGIRDTSRVAAQIVTGIGFIGAGTVLRNGPMVFGLTTAATLWIAASIGMACGAGMYGVAILSVVLSVAVLTLIRIFERQFLPRNGKLLKKYKVTLSCDKLQVEKLHNLLISNVDKVVDFSIKNMVENSDKVKLSTFVELQPKRDMLFLYEKMKDYVSLDSISVQELND